MNETAVKVAKIAARVVIAEMGYIGTSRIIDGMRTEKTEGGICTEVAHFGLSVAGGWITEEMIAACAKGWYMIGKAVVDTL